MMKLLLVSLAAAVLPLGAAAESSPYAGQQARAIKSLSEGDVQELLSGHGRGLAKAAELNGYPGPAHVLEHAPALGLSPQQHAATQALMQRHQARAREMGRELVEAERRLDEAFARRDIDAGQLAALTAEIGRRQAELRQEHLRTHLEQTALLDEHQIRRYAQLRGYTGTPGPGAGHTPHTGHR
jgi:hypothetical protein